MNIIKKYSTFSLSALVPKLLAIQNHQIFQMLYNASDENLQKFPVPNQIRQHLLGIYLKIIRRLSQVNNFGKE